MVEKSQLKAQGLRFARSLQMIVKMVNMFSADHKSAGGLMQRSYDQLNALVKQARHVTIGFVDNRVLINNILTADDSLKPLENELLKRSIGAVTFEAGITLAAYKQAIATIAANPKLIEESGGLMPFLEQRQLEFVRVFPANKNEVRNEDGDTVLEVGSEEFLISKALSGMNAGYGAGGIESLLVHMDPGVGISAGDGAGGAGGGLGGGGVFGAGTGAGSGTGSGTGGGTGPGGGGVAGGGGPGSGPGGGGWGGSTGPVNSFSEIQRAVEMKFEASLRNPQEDPQKAYLDLAKMLSTVRPDAVLSSLSLDRAQGQPPESKEEMTSQVFEDSALRWALHRLTTTPAGEDAIAVEEQIFRVLMRSLQATHAASRLARKLAEFAREYALPKHTYDRLQEEIRWTTLTPQQRLRDLLGVAHFSAAQFRRSLELIKELIKLGKPADAAAVGFQYFVIFEDHAGIKMEEVGRIPDLLRSLAGVQSEFWSFAADCLAKALLSEKLNQFVHVQTVNALVTLGKIAATYENFILVHQVGTALEQSGARDLKVHAVCCTPALANLLAPSVVDRIAELYLQKKDDSIWVKTVAALLRWTGQSAMDRLFTKLETEQLAVNRFALIRLLARSGPVGLQAARDRLNHPEWYVVRNACKILGDLRDPELLKDLEPVFRRQDERVQKAALQAVRESRLPGRAAAIAEALPHLLAAVSEEALTELLFQQEPSSLPGMGKYLDTPGISPRNLSRAVHVISGIVNDEAADLLAKVASDKKFDEAGRKSAREALSRRTSAHAKELFRQIEQGEGALSHPDLGYAGA